MLEGPLLNGGKTRRIRGRLTKGRKKNGFEEERPQL